MGVATTCRHTREELWQNAVTQLTRCVGKYLFALNPEVVQEKRLLDVDPIDSYLEDLTRGSGVGDEWGTSHRILAHKAAVRS
jgi:hypothetical protein